MSIMQLLRRENTDPLQEQQLAESPLQPLGLHYLKYKHLHF